MDRSPTETASRQLVRRAWYVHIFTTSGVVVGMLALEAIFDRRPRAAIFCLLLTQLIDGIDGPMARQLDVKTVVPKLDGYVLDLVIDYVTCVIVPAAFMHQFNMLPKTWGLSLTIAGLVVFLSAMWFSRTDMMTEDHWFNGFPATWNLVAPSLYVIQSPKAFNAIFVVVLALLQLTNIKFPHMMRAGQQRVATLTVSGVWLVALAFGTWRAKYVGATLTPRTNGLVTAIIICAFTYFAGLSIWRNRQRELVPALVTAS